MRSLRYRPYPRWIDAGPGSGLIRTATSVRRRWRGFCLSPKKRAIVARKGWDCRRVFAGFTNGGPLCWKRCSAEREWRSGGNQLPAERRAVEDARRLPVWWTGPIGAAAPAEGVLQQHPRSAMICFRRGSGSSPEPNGAFAICASRLHNRRAMSAGREFREWR